MQRSIESGTRVIITKSDKNRLNVGKLCVIISETDTDGYILRKFRDFSENAVTYIYKRDEFEIIYDQDLYEKNYEDGLFQAWNLMTSILTTESDEEIFSPVVRKLYGNIHYSELCNMNPFKVFSDIERYEEALPVYGDIIKYRRMKYIVIEEKEDEFIVMSNKKEIMSISKRKWKEIEKTGENVADQLNHILNF